MEAGVMPIMAKKKKRRSLPRQKWDLTIDLAEEKHLRLRERGTFFLKDYVDGNLFGDFVSDLFYIKPQLEKEKKKRLLVVLNCRGGEAAQGFAIFDALRAFAEDGWEVITLGMGEVYSATAAILQAGTDRVALPTTQFLLHEVHVENPFEEYPGYTEMKEFVTEIERMNNIYLKIIAERVGLRLASLQALVRKRENYFGATEAKKIGKHGLIDRIVKTIPFPTV